MRRRGSSGDDPVVLSIDAGDVEVIGTGNELTFAIRGHRKLKSGRYEFMRVRVSACRHSVKLLLDQLREMHARDRRRIQRELARIEEETRALMPPSGGTGV